MAGFWISVFFINLICGMLAGSIYGKRGQSEGVGFLCGLLLGPLGIVLAYISRADQAGLERQAIAGGHLKKCPRCAELIKAEAVLCRYCGTEVKS